jgi:hypothetical protein
VIYNFIHENPKKLLQEEPKMNLRKTFFIILAIIASLVFLKTSIHALLWVNDIVPVFDDGEGLKKQEIESHVISGASFFLQAQSYASLLLNEYELSGKQPFSVEKALKYTETSINLLENARDQYVSAYGIGESVGYSVVKISRLRSFDYNAFIIENRLNKDIAKKVQGYLSSGDIVGIYQQAANDITAILTTMYIIRKSLKINEKPGVHLYWNLLQQFSESSLFGNYATMMGTTVLGISVD